MLNILFADLGMIGSGYIWDLCRKRNHNLKKVRNGEEAVEEAKKRKYDLIFVDDMYEAIERGHAKLTGLSAIRKIRESDPQVPIYFTSKKSISDFYWKEAGASGFIFKDINQPNIWTTSYDPTIRDFVAYESKIEKIISKYERKHKRNAKPQILMNL